MATEIYLGLPPQCIIDWIKSHSKPARHPETRFILSDGTVKTHDIVGTLDQQWMIDNGYYDGDSLTWIKTITQADIGNTVTRVEFGAFNSCGSLTSVTISNGVTNIGDHAFWNCGMLSSVTIPDSVTSIVNGAFGSCGLSSVTIPNSVSSIGDYAFSSCRLSSVTIGNGVTSIGTGAFNTCSYLTSVEFKGNAPTVGNSAFNGVASRCKAIVSSTATGFPAAGETWNGLIVEVKS